MRIDFLTTAEAADFLGWHPEYVRQLAREGRIPCIRWGGRWGFDQGKLERWVGAGSPRRQEQPQLFELSADG